MTEAGKPVKKANNHSKANTINSSISLPNGILLKGFNKNTMKK